MTLPSPTINLPRRSRPVPACAAIVVAAPCWIGFAVIAMLVAAGHTDAIDRMGLLFWRDGALAPRGPEKLAEMVRDVTALGGVFLRNLFALAAAAALLLMRLRREAAFFVLTVVLGWIVNTGIKHIAARARPEIVPHLTEAAGPSFPSGHSFNAAVVYIAMALAFAALSSRRSVRLTVIGAAVLGSLAIAWSRVWLGVHWPSDVLAGWFGGAAWAFTASALLHRPARGHSGAA